MIIIFHYIENCGLHPMEYQLPRIQRDVRRARGFLRDFDGENRTQYVIFMNFEYVELQTRIR